MVASLISAIVVLPPIIWRTMVMGLHEEHVGMANIILLVVLIVMALLRLK